MKIIITGGAGFIGSNAAKSFSDKGCEILIIDDLSRSGSELNLKWLNEKGVNFKFHKIDITDPLKIENIFKKNRVDVILHLAAQVAVTTSIIEPRRDFEINALGTFNLLEAMRKYQPESIFLNASTNKVYGKLTGFKVIEKKNKYVLKTNSNGVSENTPVDFYSPYGCSKGAADQYCIDYARIYGLKIVSFRQSCIYGTRQFGIEDQGWVAWFIIAHLLDRRISVYGNGKQVRDILFVDDLIRAYDSAINHITQIPGQVFNIGGGKSNALSILEFLNIVEKLSEKKVNYSFADWRSGDQPLFISDNTKAASLINWRPETDYKTGIKIIFEWIKNNINTISKKYEKLYKFN